MYLSPIWPKLALFSAGVFFHGAADHVMVATISHAPDVNTVAPGLAVWGLALFDLIVAAALFATYRHFEGTMHGIRR